VCVVCVLCVFGICVCCFVVCDICLCVCVCVVGVCACVVCVCGKIIVLILCSVFLTFPCLSKMCPEILYVFIYSGVGCWLQN